jgi:hypothetical protein
MNQWIMNLCLPLIGQPLEAKLLLQPSRILSDSCSRTDALFAGMGKVSRPTCPDVEIQTVIRMATGSTGSSCLRSWRVTQVTQNDTDKFDRLLIRNW